MNSSVSELLPFKKAVLGTAGLGGIWGKIKPDESVNTIIQAFENGISAVDTAPAYGDAESFLGTALKQWQGKKPIISTKVGRLKSYATDACFYDYSETAMIKSVENSLQTIGIDKIDILFLHEPSAIARTDIERVLIQMLWFKEKGYVSKIGLGGNAPDWFSPYLSSSYFDVIMEYNKLNACCIDAMQSTIPFCKINNLEYYDASPLNMGLLGTGFVKFLKSPPHWLAQRSIKQAKKINRLAEKHQCSLDEFAHRFLLNFKSSFKIVFGPSNQLELDNTLKALRSGPLDPNAFEEILTTFN